MNHESSFYASLFPTKQCNTRRVTYQYILHNAHGENESAIRAKLIWRWVMVRKTT